MFQGDDPTIPVQPRTIQDINDTLHHVAASCAFSSPGCRDAVRPGSIHSHTSLIWTFRRLSSLEAKWEGSSLIEGPKFLSKSKVDTTLLCVQHFNETGFGGRVTPWEAIVALGIYEYSGHTARQNSLISDESLVTCTRGSCYEIDLLTHHSGRTMPCQRASRTSIATWHHQA